MPMILTQTDQSYEQVRPAFSEQVKKCVVHNYVVSFQSLRKKKTKAKGHEVLGFGPMMKVKRIGKKAKDKVRRL